jgi:hypothetical protein
MRPCIISGGCGNLSGLPLVHGGERKVLVEFFLSPLVAFTRVDACKIIGEGEILSFRERRVGKGGNGLAYTGLTRDGRMSCRTTWALVTSGA